MPRPVEVTDPRFDALSDMVESLSTTVRLQGERLTALGTATEALLATQTSQRDRLDAMASQLADLSVLQATQSATLAEYGGRIAALDVRVTALEPVPVPPAPVDCVLSDWRLESVEPWGPCQPSGTQTRSEVWVRDVLTPPSNGGALCGSLRETRIGTQACTYVPPTPPPTGGNAYFDALRARPDFWKGWRGNEMGSYDPSQDAATVVIPAFLPRTLLGPAISATDTRVVPATWSTAYVINAQIRIDGEVLIITAPDASTVSPRGLTVARGQYGTTATAHASGTQIFSANNSASQQRFPLITEDGHTYLATWDVRFGSSFLGTGLAGNKTFQFTSGGDQIWLEIKTNMNGVGAAPGFDTTQHVGGLGVRSYNKPQPTPAITDWALTTGDMVGPGVTDNDPLSPRLGVFTIYPDRWTRYWAQIEQRANDWDRFSLWIADTLQPAVPIFRDVPVSVRPPHRIEKFWIEFNDSDPRLPAGRCTDFRDLVAHVRNLAVLRDVADVVPLLVQP